MTSASAFVWLNCNVQHRKKGPALITGPGHHNRKIMSRKTTEEHTPSEHGGKRQGAGRPSEDRIRVVAYVKPATYHAIKVIQDIYGCKPGHALDRLLIGEEQEADDRDARQAGL